jgi:hypothetical protein
MQCTYKIPGGCFEGMLCNQIDCLDHIHIIICNTDPLVIMNINGKMTPKIMRYIDFGYRYKNYYKWIHLYMYMKHELGNVNYDIFTNLTYYYINNKYLS